MPIKLSFLLVLGFVLAVNSSPNNKISSNLQYHLDQGRRVNVIVTFVEGTTAALQSVKSLRISSRQQRLNAIHRSYVEVTEKSQNGVLKLLSSLNKVEFKSFWITNQIFVRNADSSVVNLIAQDPQVQSIDEEVVIHLEVPLAVKNAAADDNKWGVVKIKAPEAWKEIGLKFNNDTTPVDTGVVVATIDTGVRGTHEALKDNFLGDYGWLDPIKKAPSPIDEGGHGTHVTGIIVGRNGIGVAPGAKWASCRACTISCFQVDVLACGQFFTCPTLANGSNPDCSRAPHIISNSWGGSTSQPWFDSVIRTWHTAGIIPVFSMGNSGPSCNTTSYPGNHQDVIAVGSTTSDDAISPFSSSGPTIDGRIKPEIVAPGSFITSAYHTSNKAYAALSGTSMACPHVAGVIALLLARDKQLTYQEVKNFLLQNTDQNLQFDGRTCSNIKDNVFPNSVFGHGRLNALKSVQAQTRYVRPAAASAASTSFSFKYIIYLYLAYLTVLGGRVIKFE